MHRVAVSKSYGGLDPHVIRTQWAWRDLWEAHAVLDAFARRGAEE